MQLSKVLLLGGFLTSGLGEPIPGKGELFSMAFVDSSAALDRRFFVARGCMNRTSIPFMLYLYKLVWLQFRF